MQFISRICPAAFRGFIVAVLIPEIMDDGYPVHTKLFFMFSF